MPAAVSKRPRGRPPGMGLTPPGATAYQRAQASRAARRVGRVELPGDVLTALDALAQRHGDASRAAAVARLVREAR